MPNHRSLLFFAFAALGLASTLHADPLDHWSKRESGTSANLSAVTYGADRFVAVGQYGVRLFSTNGTDWTHASQALNPDFTSIAYGAGMFVTVGDEGFIYTSTDAVTWTQRTSITTNDLLCVRWVKDRFLVVGDGGTLLSSADGVDWTPRNSGTIASLTSVTFGGGLFMVAGADFFNSEFILRSVDGENWTPLASGIESSYDLLWQEGRFLSLSFRGRVQISTNSGQNWTLIFKTVNFDYNFAITRVHDRFLAVGGPYSGGSQKVVSSPDGFTWKLHPIEVNNTGNLRGVAVGNNTAVAVGEKGLIVQSDSLFRLYPAAIFPGNGSEWILHGEAGRPYRFQYSSDATGASWLDLTNFISTNDVITLRDPTTPLPPARFYRIATP